MSGEIRFVMANSTSSATAGGDSGLANAEAFAVNDCVWWHNRSVHSSLGYGESCRGRLIH